jgi:thymidylate synthase ThyX
MVLPQSMMTSFILKMDLRNLLHLIELRMHSHAQAEFQEYAIVLFDIVKDWCPLVAEAFEEYVLHASRLSKTQVKATQELLHSGEIKTELSEREDKELKQVLKIT